MNHMLINVALVFLLTNKSNNTINPKKFLMTMFGSINFEKKYKKEKHTRKMKNTCFKLKSNLF